MATTTRKPRSRMVTSVNDKAASVPKAIIEAMVKVFTLNKTKNAADRDYKKAREGLLGLMQGEGRNKASITEKIADPEKPGSFLTVSLTAEVETGETRFVDVAKLLKLVPMDEKLIGVLKAGVTDVEKVFGKATLAQCSDTKKGETNVSVGPTK